MLEAAKYGDEERKRGMSNENVDDDTFFVIENAGNQNSIEQNLPKSRSIVDICYMWNEIHRTFNNHARGIECQFKDWKLVKSRRKGLLTQLFFKCQMCHYEDNIWSEPIQSDKLDLNAAAVVGTMTVGIGYFQLEELCASMDICCMAENTYIKYRESVVDDFEQTAMESMKMAGKMEKQMALENSETINDIPYITVVADGSWMKRSYGTAYDSLSGAGAIIGLRTGRVLFVGIRNKYCTICDFAERNNIEPRSHKCYKNFDRNASSTRMESDVIVEGFKSSLEMHGLIYKIVVADGDSSVYQSILGNKPYQEQMITVQKVECTNHLLRNLCKKLKTIAESTQPSMQRKRGFVQVRNILKNNILKIRKEVIEAAALRREQKQPHHLKAMELQKDVLNIPSHIFGEHKRCKERGRLCLDNVDEKETNYIPYLKIHGLYPKIENVIKYLSAHFDSLLLHLTNNLAESFNSIICKEIGGKRINFGKRGSYNARIAGAVVQHNTQQVLTEMHKNMHKDVPAVIHSLEKRRQIKVERTKASRKVNGRKKKLTVKSGTDRHYGPQSQKPDLPQDVFEQLCENHLNKLLENGEKWKEIECDTRGQHECELWHSLRNEMLTASNFGAVCRMRSTTSCAVNVKNILFPPCVDTVAMKYGREKKAIAKKEIVAKINKNIETCGLFIDRNNPCLAASPDGLIDEDGVIEIKCPLSAENLTAEEAVETLPLLKGIFDKNNSEKMNRNYRFFYQVQGQLNITQRNYCIFAVWTPKSCKMVRVDRDNDFWKNKMLPFLLRFYNECMLPEILDSRHNRHMPIRNPRYILDAREEASLKKEMELSKRENIIQNDFQPCKRLKGDVLPVQAIKATADCLMTEQDDDCIIVSSCNRINETEDDIVIRKQILDDMIAPLSIVRKNVLSMNSTLND